MRLPQTRPTPQDVGNIALLVTAGAISLLLDLKLAGFAVVVAGFGLAGHGLAAAIAPARTRLDHSLVALTFAFATLAVVAEMLSLAVLLGSIAAWTTSAELCGIAGVLVRRWGCPLPRYTHDVPLPPAPLQERGGAGRAGLLVPFGRAGVTFAGDTDRLTLAGSALAALLLLAAGLHLGTEFVLSWFAGINVGDSLTHYLPRSVRFLQYGTFGIEKTYYDFMQYLHQTFVAVQFLFLRTDVLVNPTSFVAACLTGLAVFASARSLGWSRPYPLFAALALLSMPLVLLHATTSNFDIFTALWIVLALYFLRRGFALSSGGWLIAAAAATALAFASKPTAWFVMPGLGLVWLATLGRAVLRGRLQRSVPAFAVCAAIFVLVGMPFMLRNVISRGYIVAPPEWQSFQLGGAETGPLHRLRLLEFNTLALGLELVTPPYLLPDHLADDLDPWFAARAKALGYRLPDPAITVHTDWSGLIRHASHRYDSNHASLGAAFLLVTLPSLLALPFARRRLGPRWWYTVGLAGVGLSYFIVLNMMSIYSVNNSRYLIEMAAILAPLGPALFTLLPARIGGALALAVGTVLVGEMHDVVIHNKQAPPDLVLRVPRAEQYFVFNGNFPTAARAAALLDQKYPPDEYPDIYIEDNGVPNFPDYTVLGPSLQRHTHYLRVPETPADLIGPMLTRERILVERLTGGGLAVADQLATDVWLILPNDRPRVRFWSTRGQDGGLLLRIEASVPPGEFREPRFAFTVRTSRGEDRLRDFEASPVFEVRFDVAARGTLQVEIRDGDSSRKIERIRIERARFMGI
ncbi:MAG: ArnT family glycosyltransferase [Chloroflexota bacterium]